MKNDESGAGYPLFKKIRAQAGISRAILPAIALHLLTAVCIQQIMVLHQWAIALLPIFDIVYSLRMVHQIESERRIEETIQVTLVLAAPQARKIWFCATSWTI